MGEETGLSFREVQRFSLWLRMVTAAAMFFGAAVVVLGLVTEGSLDKPLAVVGSAGLVFLLAAIGVVFFVFRLETEVRTDGLYFRFFPLHIHYKKIAAEELSESYARRYRPILEYGGWGIRWGFKGGRAYNVSGNEGLQLVFKDGRRLLIGSQRADELAAAVSAVHAGKI